jgi:hypothetical protein
MGSLSPAVADGQVPGDRGFAVRAEPPLDEPPDEDPPLPDEEAPPEDPERTDVVVEDLGVAVPPLVLPVSVYPRPRTARPPLGAAGAAGRTTTGK